MLNMSKAYFDFLSRRFINWTKRVTISASDRYVLSFENQQQVSSFMESMLLQPAVNQFPITTSGIDLTGLSVSTIGQERIVLVSTNDVTPDYLVGLRNKIGRQDGIWKGTALLFVSDRVLDSINSGAKDISRQGGPFNLEALHNNLKSEIQDNQILSEMDKTVLDEMVKIVFEDDQTYTLMDFAEVYSIIEKGHVEADDFNKMGYFTDKNLDSYAKSDLKQRLDGNHEDFYVINQCHDFEDVEDVKERVAKQVAGDKLIKSLVGVDWKSTDYGDILAGKDDLKRSNQIDFQFDAASLSASVTEVWNRVKSETKAGRRNRSIVIFNDQVQNQVILTLPFDHRIQQDGIKTLNQTPFEVTNKSIRLTFKDAQHVKWEKITYVHQKKSSLRFTFNIIVIPIAAAIVRQLQPYYDLKITKKIAKFEIASDIESLELGNGDEISLIKPQVAEDILKLVIGVNQSVKLDFGELDFEDAESIDCQISIDQVAFVLSILDQNTKVIPKNAVWLENYRRQHHNDGYYNNRKIVLGDTLASLYGEHRRFLDLEAQAIQSEQVFSDSFQDIEISHELLKRYQSFFDVLKKRETLASLAYWDEQIKQCVQSIIDEVVTEIEGATEKVSLTSTTAAIVHIGEYHFDNGEIAVAPFNPISLAYQMSVEEATNQEKLSDTIQRKLNPDYLVPYLKRDQQVYKAYYNTNAPRWICYSESKLSEFGSASQNVVAERLKDFKKHFGYLFRIGENSAYNIRVIYVEEEKELLIGIINYLFAEIKALVRHRGRLSIDKVTPVNVYLKNTHTTVDSDFNLFYQLQNGDDFNQFFGEPLTSIMGITGTEILSLLQRKINIFYGENKSNSYHITFYQFRNKLALDQYDTNQLNMNYSIGGLIGGNEYTTVQNNVKTGFGTKNLAPDQQTAILKFASVWNELLVATINKYSSMIKGQALTNTVEEVDDEDFQELFDHSQWVTLLNPEVKLDYFNKMSHEIYVIHYTDYTNSANYESVTLTKQVEQYENILSENLPGNVDQRNHQVYLKNAIKSFNAINGEWLLRLVSHHDQANTVKEKLSILATYKEMLGILQTNDIIWIPISLEEILRVAGSFVGETRTDAIFSAKSLGLSGQISDDLLFIGLWKYAGQLRMTFLPTEVKVGKNQGNVIKKAVNQVSQTYEVLDRELTNKSFKAKFYRDFFMKLYYANAAKLYSNGELSNDVYQQLEQMKIECLEGRLLVDNSVTDCYHHKFVFSLKAGSTDRLIRVLETQSMVNVPEKDAFEFAGVSTGEIIAKVQEDKLGFKIERLLRNQLPVSNDLFEENTSNKLVAETTNDYHSENRKEISSKFDQSTNLEENEEATGRGNSLLAEKSNKPIISRVTSTAIDDKRVKIGTLDGATSPVYWEYGNSELANRHMLITGKSGQGKTYFMQMLLWELSKQNISSLVVDYTDSYLPGQLDSSLEAVMNHKIKQHIIYSENLPVNPFKRQKIKIGDVIIDENEDDVIDRVAEVLDFVFSLGIQQKSHLKTVMKSGYQSTAQYTFSKLKQQLLDEDENSTLYGRLQPLLNNDRFSYDRDDFDWSEYFNHSGTVNVIQLKGLQSSVQNVIIEFVLWDLFQYSQMHTDLVYPVFLDEVQNLNFSKDAPTVKILREGRKFGWSGIFATQSLSSIKGEVDAIFNTAEQVHFLPPENQTKFIAKTISSDRNIQGEYEQMLTELVKGQCIVHGPMLDSQHRLIKEAKVVDVDSFDKRQ